MLAWICALTLAAAVGLALWRPRRRTDASLPGRPTQRSERRTSTPVFARWRRSRDADVSLAAVCIEVASRLRAGAGVNEAWERALSRGDLEVAVLAGSPPPGAAAAPWMIPDGEADVPARLLCLAGHSSAADAAIAACRLAHVAGTPLADVLETCATGIAEAEAAHADRRRALAGPASTAKLLGWLPVASLLLGSSLGSDPIGVALKGGLGLLSLVLGAGLLVAGRAWTRGLVRMAERSGSDGRPP